MKDSQTAWFKVFHCTATDPIKLIFLNENEISRTIRVWNKSLLMEKEYSMKSEKRCELYAVFKLSEGVPLLWTLTTLRYRLFLAYQINSG